MLENSARCLFRYVKDMPFFIPLSISELFIMETAALPVLPRLVIGTETKHLYVADCFEMQHFYGLLETHLPTKGHL